jgi:hypothetical protein
LFLLAHLFAGLANCIRGALQAVSGPIFLTIEARGDFHPCLTERLAGFFLNLFRGRSYLFANTILGLPDTTPLSSRDLL